MLASLVSMAAINLFTFAFFALLVLYLSRSLGLAPGTIGIVIAVGAVGGVAGAVLAGPVGRGVGIGFAFASMANLIVEAVDQSQTGVATGMNTIMRTVGGSLGGQISATIVSANVIAGTQIAEESGYTIAFFLSSAVMVLAFFATYQLSQDEKEGY